MNKKKWIILALMVYLGILSGCGKVVQEPGDKFNAEATVDLLASREDSETESDTDPPESVEEASIADSLAERFVIDQEQNSVLDEDGTYTSKEEVADYIHEFGHLPGNYITKKEARKLGWNGGSLEQYAPGKSIGGDYFGNYEELLPTKKGRRYYECDIDTLGKKSRGAKRIVYSNDGLIFYTEDHYESFELIYDEP